MFVSGLSMTRRHSCLAPCFARYAAEVRLGEADVDACGAGSDDDGDGASSASAVGLLIRRLYAEVRAVSPAPDQWVT